MTDRLLLIFIKNPVLGKVKTRLAATIGNKAALSIYRKLLDYTKQITEELQVDKAVFYSDRIEDRDQWDHQTFIKKLQAHGDLGDRMQAAFRWGFDSGYKQICIIGSDCYELTPERIMEAFDRLTKHTAVLGPTHDGGYYLLGLTELRKELFSNKAWGMQTVAADTIADFLKLGWSYSTLQLLKDIDVEEDLPKQFMEL